MNIQVAIKDKDYGKSLKRYIINNKPTWNLVDSDGSIILTDHLSTNKTVPTYFLSETSDCSLPYLYKYQHISNILSQIKSVNTVSEIFIHIQDFTKFESILTQVSKVLIGESLSHFFVPITYPSLTASEKTINPERILMGNLKLSDLIVHDQLQIAPCISSVKDLYNKRCASYLQKYFENAPFHVIVYATSFPYPILENLSCNHYFEISKSEDCSIHNDLEQLLNKKCTYIDESEIEKIVKYF